MKIDRMKEIKQKLSIYKTKKKIVETDGEEKG